MNELSGETSSGSERYEVASDEGKQSACPTSSVGTFWPGPLPGNEMGGSPNPLSQNIRRYILKQNKDTRMTIRLTQDEYESICSRAASAMMTPSAYVRAAAMRHKITVVPGLKELTHELKGIGRNLNQLTMLAHAGVIQSIDLTETEGRLEQVYIGVSELAAKEHR